MLSVYSTRTKKVGTVSFILIPSFLHQRKFKRSSALLKVICYFKGVNVGINKETVNKDKKLKIMVQRHTVYIMYIV